MRYPEAFHLQRFPPVLESPFQAWDLDIISQYIEGESSFSYTCITPSMASKVITYVWKLARPVDDTAAGKVMAAAYQSAMATDPNTTTVLIRYTTFHSSESSI